MLLLDPVCEKVCQFLPEAGEQHVCTDRSTAAMEPLGWLAHWPLSFLLFSTSLFLFLWWGTQANSRNNLPPGPRPLPLLGNLLQLRGATMLESLHKLKDTYGPVFTLYFGTQKVVMLCGFQTVKEALMDHGEQFSGRPEIPLTTRTTNGQGVFFSNGELWKQVRRFSLATLRNFGMGKRSIEERIQEELQFLVEDLRKTKELPFDPTFFIRRSVSNVICSIMFGKRFEYTDKKLQILLDLIAENLKRVDNFWVQMYNLIPSILDRFPGPHQKLFENYKDQLRFVEEIMLEHLETLDPSSPRDYIDAFLIKIKQQEKADTSSIFYPENLLISSLDLFFAGSESTSTTLRYGLLLLLKYPEVEEMIQEEIERVIGQNQIPCMDDRCKMPYTDAVIHEIQRFIDIFPLGVPHSVTVDTNFRGYIIPKDTIVMPVLNTVLHDLEHFEHPKIFNPENFLENGLFKKNDAFMAFSAGKRMCIGEGLARTELFLFFTTILQKFKLRAAVDKDSIDITPEFKSLAKLPPYYQLSLLHRL